ncbi:MAG: VWA domain-containing protein [Candidatus Dadabacteria bacterium]|nr:MAG: VWA domain-containing protein [Candidatus Dadabacteria bacterium]
MSWFTSDNFNYLYPAAFLLPILLFAVIFLRKKKNTAVLYPSIALLKPVPAGIRARLRTPVIWSLSLLTLFYLTAAASGPQKVNHLRKEFSARNIMLCIDISRSMAARDFATSRGTTSRLNAVKSVVARFIRARRDDRIGLVVFGSDAYLQAPLTFDHQLLLELLKQLRVGLAGDGTAIGDGLGLSLKRIEKIKGDAKAIVLLTDGVSNQDQVDPIKAAKIAKMLHVKVHTIGIGSDRPVNIPAPGIFSGSIVRVEYDEKTLRQIADISGGVFFNASSLENLEKVYREIDKLEKTTGSKADRSYTEQLFYGYLFYAFLFYTLYQFLSYTVFCRIP